MGLPQCVPEIFAVNFSPETTLPAEVIPESKPANEWFRWNLAWFVFFCLIFIPAPIWLYSVSCVGGYLASVVVSLWQCVVLFACMVNGTITMIKMYKVRDRNWLKEDIENEKLVHLVCMAGYKEPLEVMFSTVDSLKRQTISNQLVVVVGLEERTPDFELKKRKLLDRYDGDFRHMMVTKHPFGIPGELPGKSSNTNYAVRQGRKELRDLGLYNLDRCIVTTCDTDNPFSRKYFEYLGWDFLRTANRKECVWQAPLLYNFDLDKRPFFVRVTGILRAVFMMGILIPQNITSMSIFSMSLELMEKGFVHPGYQMEDIINIVRRMISIHKLVEIRLIPYPVISGPTSGETYTQELVEWARQARRWTIGAAEVFHYFCIKWSKYDFWSGVIYSIIFTHYYGFVICGMSLFSLVNIISSTVYLELDICVPSQFLPEEYFFYLPLIGVIVSYLFFAWAFIMDRLGTHLTRVEENINILRNILHWLFAPLVLLAYSLVEFYAITEVALFGKSVCKHGASKKNGLVKKSCGEHQRSCTDTMMGCII